MKCGVGGVKRALTGVSGAGRGRTTEVMETEATPVRLVDPVARATRDPFTVPRRTHPIGAVAHRDRVVVTGISVRVSAVRWVGGPVLEVDLRDETGALRLAFVGRTGIAGVQTGALLTVAGVVGRHRGEPVVFNPFLWLGRARPEPRFVVHPPAGTGVSPERRVVAVASADQVGAVLAAPRPEERRHAHG